MEPRLRASRLLISLSALFLALLPPVADFNASHVLHPEWPGHARLHTVWLVCSNSAVALLALWIAWRRTDAASLRLAAALLGCVLVGFFAAAASQGLYAGALTDVGDAARRVGPVDGNLAAFSIGAVLVASAAFLARGRPSA